MTALLILFGNDIRADQAGLIESNQISFKMGYVMPSREDFRDIYNGHINIELGYIRHIRGKLFWGLDGGLKTMSTGILKLNYKCYYLSASTRLALVNNKYWYSDLCGGVGYAMRTISTDKLPLYNEEGGFVRNLKKKETDWAPMLFVGGDILLPVCTGWFCGGSFILDYYYDPHPETGDFGNTGAYNFRFIIRHSFN